MATKNFMAGRGKVGFSKREADGTLAPLNFTGNVSTLSIDLEIEREEIYDTEDGQNLLAGSFIKRKKGTLKGTFHELSKANAALFFQGTSTTIAADAAVVDSFPAAEVVAGNVLKASRTNISSLVLDDAGSTTAFVLGTHYTQDLDFGYITIVSVPAGFVGPLELEYSAAAVDAVQFFTADEADEYYMHYMSLNKGNFDKKVMWELYRLRFKPPTSAQVHGDTYAALEIEADVYADTAKASDANFGQFGRVLFVDDID